MTSLKFNKIIDINARKEIKTFKSWCKNKKKCLYKNKKRKYHGWSHLDNLKNGKTIQCGYFSGSCDTRTIKGIGGYRNTCPIGGYNGDFIAPAKLRISNFKINKDVTTTSKIKGVKVTFKHRMHGIGTKSGKAYFGNSNSPNFESSAKNDAIKIYFSNGDKVISETIKRGNPNNRNKKWTTINCTFKKITAEELLKNNFALNLEYNFNRSTNPGIIYIKSLKIDLDYDSSKKYIEGVSKPDSLYTSAEINSPCLSSVMHVIEAGYKNGKTKIPVSKAPIKLGNKIKCISSPNGVTVSKIGSDDLKSSFNIIDKSGVLGVKKIRYALSDDLKQYVDVHYEAKEIIRPEFAIASKYKFNEDFDNNKSYISFKNGCASSISIYIDSLNSEPLVLSVANQNSPTNLLDKSQVKAFHDKVKSLKCGAHLLYIKRGNEGMASVRQNRVRIEISPMNFKFMLFSSLNNGLSFVQNKQNRYAPVFIRRIDNEPIAKIPSISVIDGTRRSGEPFIINNVQKNSDMEYNIDTYYSGKFNIIIEDNAQCKGNKSIFTVDIQGAHKQNYDYLITRGQDGTAFDFDYLVAWEGDDLKEPISVNSINFVNSKENIGICSEDTQAGLSQIGTAVLKVKNLTDEDMENIPIELNIIDEDGIVTTNEWVSLDGLFNQFYVLFDEYNKGSGIKILNLTPDNDLVDEENVILMIDKISANSTMSINLPFRSVVEKSVSMQFLFAEEPLAINSFFECRTLTKADNIEKYNDMVDSIKIEVNDSMLTNLEILGNTDILRINKSFPCPNECYTTTTPDDEGSYDTDLNDGGITYKITNIDTNDFLNQSSVTEVINDPKMQPYGYEIDGKYYSLIDNNGNPLEVDEERYLKDYDGNIQYYPKINANGEIIYDENGNTLLDLTKPIKLPNKVKWVKRVESVRDKMINYNIKCFVQFPVSEKKEYVIKTDRNGSATFFIPIPVSLNKSYTIEELLREVLIFRFDGDYYHTGYTLTKKSNIIQNDDPNKNQTIMQYSDNFRRYKPGEVASITVDLHSITKIMRNNFIFNAELKDNNHSDEFTVFYKVCNLNNNEGILKTTFRTNDKKLIKNEISKNIYCGIDTDLKVSKKLDKKIVENHNINIVNLHVANGKKENHDVEVSLNLGAKDISHTGRYDFLEIDINSGDYSIIDDNGNITVSWLIGKMNSYEKQKAVIRIKAKDIGLSDIQVNSYDYLHKKDSTEIIKDSVCEKCDNNTWEIVDSQWKTLSDGLKWKLFNDGVYRRKINGKWVAKE